MIKRGHHIGLSTGNIRRLCHFYCDVLGFQLLMEMDWKPGTELGAQVDRIIGLKDTASKVAMVSKDDFVIELVEYSAPTPKPMPPDWKVCDHGYSHICLEVDDIDAEYKRLVQAGMTFHAPPPADAYNGVKAIYGRDPEGNVIEILEMIPAA